MTVKTRLEKLEKRNGGAGCGDSPGVPGACPRLPPVVFDAGAVPHTDNCGGKWNPTEYTACAVCGRPPLVIRVHIPDTPETTFVREVSRGVWKVYGGIDLMQTV